MTSTINQSSDATPAYRGYRLQALYTLYRVLNQEGPSRKFQPEGSEDLAIYDSEHRLLEIIQVKQRSSSLSLSSFKPEKPNSFFYRASAELERNPNLLITLVAFGAVGPELCNALKNSGSDRTNVAGKIENYGHLTKAKVTEVIDKAILQPVDESDLTAKVHTTLKESLPGVDPESAFDLLMRWLYDCAENQTIVTRATVIDRINRVGEFVVARAAYHMEWFTSIIPLEDTLTEAVSHRDALANEFYQGISARYDHILADLDVIRDQKLSAIDGAFRKHRIVIVHAASGQGKTTLAYRYLRDFFPSQWRFRVTSMGSREQVLRAAFAIAKHADAIGIPIAVYVDVAPRNTEWLELVRQLAGHPKVQVLVTIREEDWRRTNVSDAEMPFVGVELDFDRTEAHAIYQALTSKLTPTNTLDFDEAWAKFGETGPLMEFIHLVTQGTSLRVRLKQQVTNLQNEVRIGRLHPSELILLRLVAVASAFEARLCLLPLVQRLKLTSPQGTLELFEKEYLLRVSQNGRLLSGLHPIRSAVLSELLSDSELAPWRESAADCLPFIEEDDVESFLLYAFSRRRKELDQLLAALGNYEPTSWTAIIGCIRSLIWLGVAEYIETNQDVIRDAAEQVGRPGWANFLDFDLTSSSHENIAKNWWRDTTLVPQEGQKLLEELQARQSDKNEVFTRVKQWLSHRNEQPEIPVDEQKWEGCAESVFWLQHLGIVWPVKAWLPQGALDAAFQSLSIAAIANLAFALAESRQFEGWLNENRPSCLERFRRELLSVRLEDNGETVATHFVYDMDRFDETSSASEAKKVAVPQKGFDRQTLQRIELLRKLLPDRERFSGKGYGHLFWEGFLDFDPSEKSGIARKQLTIRWLTSVNSLLGGLGNQQFRPKSWQDYANQIMALRENVLNCFGNLEKALEKHFRRSVPTPIWESEVDSESWRACKSMLNTSPMLPINAVDEWGFVSESSSREAAEEEFNRRSLVDRNGLALQKYQPHLKAFGEYTRTLSNFFHQSETAMILQPWLGKGVNQAKVSEIAEQNGLKINSARLATINLADSIKNLSAFHQAIRPVLAPFYANQSLDQLDRSEFEVFQRIWSIWYFFAAHPEKVMQNASTECGRHAAAVMMKTRLRLRDRLRGKAFQSARVSIASESISWDDQPALWLTVDVDLPWEVYPALDFVVSALRNAATVGEQEFRRQLLGFHWPYVAIVPLVRDRYTLPIAWRINLAILLQSDQANSLKWWNLVQQPIPAHALAQLKLQAWDLQDLSIGTKLQEAVLGLFLIASHIRDLRRLVEPDDIDELGSDIFQGYLTRLSTKLVQALALAQGAYNELSTALLSSPTSDIESSVPLGEAAQLLIELNGLILPSEDFTGEMNLTLDGLCEWAGRLEQAQQRALFCSLGWTGYVIERSR